MMSMNMMNAFRLVFIAIAVCFSFTVSAQIVPTRYMGIPSCTIADSSLYAVFDKEVLPFLKNELTPDNSGKFIWLHTKLKTLCDNSIRAEIAVKTGKVEEVDSVRMMTLINGFPILFSGDEKSIDSVLIPETGEIDIPDSADQEFFTTSWGSPQWGYWRDEKNGFSRFLFFLGWFNFHYAIQEVYTDSF